MSARKKVIATKNLRETLTANLEGAVEVKHPQVDFQTDEIKLIKTPIRPAEWKPVGRFIGNPSIEIAWPKVFKKSAPLRVRLASVHRPYKSGYDHTELLSVSEDSEKATSFRPVPEGHYVVLVQARGFRPFGGFFSFTETRPSLRLFPILHPVKSQDDEEQLLRLEERHPYVEHARRFLTRFGYLKEKMCTCQRDRLCSHVSMALRLFQNTYKLQSLGTLTVDSFLLMLKPRCAHPDIPLDEPQESSAGPTGTTSSDPIVFTGNRWDSFNLQYRLLTGTGDVSNEWSIIRGGMDTWAGVSPLSFSQTTGSSELEFDFRQPSESGYPFDSGGSKDGNTLAHAYPPTNGLVEFDDHEDWGSTHLDAVATHEIGHALGLGHSSVEDSTMYAWYDGGQASLHEVDVRGIKSLYAPVFYHSGSFAAYPLFAFKSKKGTDSVTIDLGQTRHFLAWGTITMIDTLTDYDRDNMCFIDVYEVDGDRTTWRVSGGDHFGSSTSPANVHEGAFVGYGRKVTFRIVSGHSGDLEVSGFAIVLVLD
ncbi:MAG: matrixin family metalloprotease [Candidatus Thorarchaeota archaeon]